MKIIKAKVFLGPNMLMPTPVTHVAVAVEGNRHWPADDAGADSTAALLSLLPGLARTGSPEGSFAERLRRTPGPPLSGVAAQVAVELLRLHDGKPRTPQVLHTPDSTTDHIAFGYDDPDIACLAGQIAVYMVLALLPPALRPANDLVDGFDPVLARDNFLKRAEAMALDQTAIALIAEAQRRDIPWFILDRGMRIVQLGQGCRRRRIRETVTDATSNIAALIQRGKDATNEIFSAAYLPVPQQVRVIDAEAAVRAARKIGYPVVVKPLDTAKGRGISVQLEDDDAVRTAFAFAQRYRPRVLVEGYIPGGDHRVLVVAGRIVAAARRVPAAVTGDGRSTVARLVAETNKEPRRGDGFSKLMNRIELDAEADRILLRRGYTRDSIPPAGETVYLRGTANISTGGTAIDVTDTIHPENRAMLERAARIVGLDVAGIDFITPDIARSYREVGGAICEINASPGLRPHQVAEGPPRDVVGPIVDLLFPNRSNGRIPTAAITGTNGKTTTARMLAHILRHAGGEIGVGCVGLATTYGVYVDGAMVAKGDFAGASGARTLLQDPMVEAAVLETARGGIAKGGLGFDWCDVGAVLNVTADHIGVDGIETLDDMSRLKGCVVEAARKLAVLNADDPRCLALAARKAPERVCLISAGSLSEPLRDHLGKGGLAICLEEEAGASTIVLHGAAAREAVIPVDRIPASLQGAARHNTENAMAAVGLAHGLGIPPKAIAEALSSFRSDIDCNPGRLNIFRGHPFTAILDFAHNPDGVRVICDTLRAMAPAGRRICVLANTGNRHGEHIDKVADIIADAFDVFICSRDSTYSEGAGDARGFAAEEIPKRLAAALADRGIAAGNILTIDSYRDALDRGLETAGEGDLLMVFADASEWCWNRIVGYRGAESTGRETGGGRATIEPSASARRQQE